MGLYRRSTGHVVHPPECVGLIVVCGVLSERDSGDSGRYDVSCNGILWMGEMGDLSGRVKLEIGVSHHASFYLQYTTLAAKLSRGQEW